MTFYRDLLIFRDNLRGRDHNMAIDNQTLRELVDLIARGHREDEKKFDALQHPLPTDAQKIEEKKEEYSQEFLIWKKFPMELSTYRHGCKLCAAIPLTQSRLGGMIYEHPKHFEGTYNRKPSTTGKKIFYWVEPVSFLEKLETFKYTKMAEKLNLQKYMKEKMQNGSGG